MNLALKQYTDMPRLAAFCFNKGLDALRPLPSWLHVRFSKRHGTKFNIGSMRFVWS